MPSSKIGRISKIRAVYILPVSEYLLDRETLRLFLIVGHPYR